MNRMLYLIPALAIGVSACGGGANHTIPALPAAVNAPQSGAQRGNLAVNIRIPSPAAASSHARRAQFISASVSSIALSFTSSSTPIAATFPITPGTGLCPTVASVTTCSFALTVPVTPPSVSGTLTITGLDISSTAISAANAPVTIDGSGAQTVNAVLGGIPAALALTISPASYRANVPATIPVVLEAFDADNNLIVGRYADANGDAVSVALTSTDTAHQPVSPAAVSQSSTGIEIAFTGAPSGVGATIAATAGALVAQAALLLTGPGSPTTLYYELQPASGNGTVVATTASATPATLRTLTMSSRPTTGGLAVSPNGTIYAISGSNTIDVFAPGSTSATPVRTIVDPNFSVALPIETIAPVNAGANLNGVFIGGSHSATAQFDTYAFNGTTPVAADTLSNITGPLTSLAQSASSGLYYVFVEAQLQVFDHAPNSGDLTVALNRDIFEASMLSAQGVTMYPAIFDNNTTACVLGDDEFDAQLMVSCGNQQTTTFNLPANGSYLLTAGGQTFTVHGVLGFAGSNVPYGLGGGNPQTIAFDTNGIAYAFNGSTIESYAQAAIQAHVTGNAGTVNVAQTFTTSGTILAATAGP